MEINRNMEINIIIKINRNKKYKILRIKYIFIVIRIQE